MEFDLLTVLGTVGGLVIASWLVILWVRHRRFRTVINRIPGSDGKLPLLGDVLEIKSDAVEYFHQYMGMCRQNFESGIMKYWTGVKPSVIVYRANTVEDLLNSSKHMEKKSSYNFLAQWLGDGLLLSKGAKWFARRKLITPTFHFKILEQFMHIFNEQAAILVGHLDKMADGKRFDIQPYMYRCMLDVICEAAMGVSVHAQDDRDSEYVRVLYRQMEIIVQRMKYPWLWSDAIFRLTKDGRDSERDLKVLHEFTTHVIDKRKAELDRTGSRSETTDSGSTVDGDLPRNARRRRLALLDMLLEQAQKDSTLNSKDIQEEVDTFMFAGHDTTASGSVWILYMLGWYPEQQYRVQQEIDRVFADGDRDVTIDDINELKFTDCFIKETLRLYPPVPWFGRVTSENCQLGGYEIPKDTSVTVSTYQLHRDPQVFPDPEKFDPDRWMSDDLTARHPFCYIPFSAGMRNCIGQRFAMLELKSVLCHVMRKFSISCMSKRHQTVPYATLILRPEKPVSVELTRRR